MNIIDSQEIFVGGLPAPKPRTKKIHNRSIYLTSAAIETAKQHPGIPIRLAQGKLVDKAYFPTLKGQAHELGGGLKADWVYEKDRETLNEVSGKVSTTQVGQVFLTCTEAPVAEASAPAMQLVTETAPVAALETKAERKARKKAEKAELAQTMQAAA